MVRLACHAMATRFELVLAGAPEPQLRAAGEQAIALIHGLEARLSCYRASSEIGRVNALAAERPVRIDGEVFGLLVRARELWERTGGAFDVTVGPLMRCWGLAGGGDGRVPTEAELDRVRGSVGMHLLELDPQNCTVRFARPGVAIDLGGIGKGHALEQAADLLREAGVTSALLHGGTSSVQAVGSAPDGRGWRVAIPYPEPAGESADRERGGADPPAVAVIELRDQALGVSAGHGKQFRAGGAWYGHVLDPRFGRPAEAALLAAAVCESGTAADAFATALLILGPAGQSLLPGAGSLVIARGDGTERYRVSARGIATRPYSATARPQAPHGE